MLAFLNGTPTKPPVLLSLRSSKTFIVTTVALAIFTDIFLYGVIVPVFPFALNSRAGIPIDNTQTWISILLAVYGAALLAGSPVCGWLADRTESRRAPLLGGLLALAGATVILTVGNSIAVLVVGRILQGFSAAVVWTVGLALLVDTMGSQGVGEAMGYVGLAMSMAVLIAPLLGGVVFDRAGYYAVFAMCFGLLGVDIVLRLALVEKKVARRWIKEEEVQQGPSDSGTSRDIEEVAEGTSQEHLDRKQDTHQVPSTGEEDRTRNPTKSPDGQSRSTNTNAVQTSDTSPTKATRNLPPILRLLTSRRLLTALLGCLMQATLLTSFDSTLPLYVRSTFHWTSIGAGLIFLPIVLPSFLDPLIGAASDKYGARWLSFIGFVLACPVLILLRLVDHNSLRQKVLLCALLVLLGFTLNLVLTPLMAEVSYATDDIVAKAPTGTYGDKGAFAQAYALFNMAYAGGCLLGPLVGGLVAERAGWGAMALVLGCLSLATAGPTLIWTGGSLREGRRKKRERQEEKGEGEGAGLELDPATR